MRASPEVEVRGKCVAPKKRLKPDENEGIWLSGSLKKRDFISFIFVVVAFFVGPDFGF